MTAQTLEEIPAHESGLVQSTGQPVWASNSTGKTIPRGAQVGVRVEQGEYRILRVIREAGR